MKIRFYFFILVIPVIACGIQYGGSASPVPEYPAPIAVPTPIHGYVVVGDVNVSSCPSTACGVVGYKYAGEVVTADCEGSWCKVDTGWVYAPCLGMEGVCK